MKFSNFSLLLLALTITPFAQANSQEALPNFAFGKVIPPGNDTILKRDRQHPPAAIGFGFKIDPPANWIVTWTEDVQALGLRLAQEETRPQPGAWLLHFRIDPCTAVGLDMPGTQIPVTYEFVFAASHSNPNKFFNPPPKKDSFILTLDRDTVKPFISSLKAPTTVRRDQTIQVAISATDVSDEMGGFSYGTPGCTSSAWRVRRTPINPASKTMSSTTAGPNRAAIR